MLVLRHINKVDYYTCNNGIYYFSGFGFES